MNKQPVNYAVGGFFFRLLVAILIVLTVIEKCNCQSYKPNVPALAFSAVSGASWGLNQTLNHHPDRFFRRFPGASYRFFGPESWRNKYWQFDPEQGRNNVPIWFTDAKHLTASGSHVSAYCAGLTITIGRKKPAWHYAFDLGLSFVSFTIGNYFTYEAL